MAEYQYDFGNAFNQSYQAGINTAQKADQFSTTVDMEQKKMEQDKALLEAHMNIMLKELASRDKQSAELNKLSYDSQTLEKQRIGIAAQAEQNKEFTLAPTLTDPTFRKFISQHISAEEVHRVHPLGQVVPGATYIPTKDYDIIKALETQKASMALAELKDKDVSSQVTAILNEANKIQQPADKKITAPGLPANVGQLVSDVLHTSPIEAYTRLSYDINTPDRVGYVTDPKESYGYLEKMSGVIQKALVLKASASTSSNKDALRDAFAPLINRFAQVTQNVTALTGGMVDETKINPENRTRTVAMATQVLNELRTQQAQQKYQEIQDTFGSMVKTDKSGAEDYRGKAMQEWQQNYGSTILQNLGSQNVRTY